MKNYMRKEVFTEEQKRKMMGRKYLYNAAKQTNGQADGSAYCARKQNIHTDKQCFVLEFSIQFYFVCASKGKQQRRRRR